MAIDMNRGTSGVSLPKEVSNEIWSKVLENSAIMNLARRIELPGRGLEVQTITGEPTAAWVNETDEKAVSNHTLATKTITPYTIAVIEPFSNQFRRDKRALYEELIRRLPYALAKTFDNTAFGGTTKPGDNFDQLSGCSAFGIKSNAWEGLVAADAAVAAGGGILNGFALAPQAKSILLTAVDGNKRPLFVNSIAESGVPMILGSPVQIKKATYVPGEPNTIGFAGDWSQAVYGTVEGVQIAISDQATLTTGGQNINLFQRNMFAVRAEIEVGFRITGSEYFVKLTDATDCALETLKIGGKTLTPAFDGSTVTYTCATTDATNTITAIARDGDATVAIKNGSTAVTSGSAATWDSGANTVTVTVTNGDYSKTYTITVTKS